MHTMEVAIHEINDFLKSDDRCMLLKGTHQYKKHPLVLSLINQFAEGKKILFRVNALDNLETFLNINRKLKTGTAYDFGKNILYVDSIKSQSWTKTPIDLDYVILYPIDSVLKSKQLDSIISDVLRRANKVFLVSWTDSYDFSVINGFIDRVGIYDVEAEDPEYHERVLEHLRQIKE